MLPLAVLISLLVPTAPAETPGPRVAVLYSSFGDFRHRDDYDATLPRLGWEAEKIENTGLAELVARLDEFDIVLCGALYNYANTQDFAAHLPAIGAFLERGGMFLITDANYAPHLDWLAGLGDGLEARPEACQSQNGVLTMPEPTHPLLTFPNSWTPSTMWSHMVLGDGWRVLARDADGGSAVAVAGQGLGAICLTSNWRLPGDCLANLWEWLRIRRLGVEVEALAGIAELHPGTAAARISCRGLVAEPSELSVSWGVTMGGAESVTEERLRLEEGRTAAAELELPVGSRGAASIRLRLRSGELRYESPEIAATVPALAVIERLRPGYRDVLLTDEPDPTVVLRVRLYPGLERLEGATLEAWIASGERDYPAVSVAAPEGYGTSVEVRIPAGGLPAQPPRVMVELRAGDEVLWRDGLPLSCTVASEGTVLDGRLAARVEGEPFFPIGIYHVPLESLPQAREMGFNCFQVWGNSPEQARQALDAAEAQEMRVLLEMGGLVRGGLQAEAFREVVEAVRDHPALLRWYPVDEPTLDGRADCETAYRICRELDPAHPVYLVLCDPGLFGSFDTTLDILGIDPYPVPGAALRMVADWTRTAVGALEARRAVWAIPQLQNLAAYAGDPAAGRAPTAEEEWCMVAQALIYGAQGIVYYPWDDGPCGLLHEPQLLEALPRINGFLAANGVAMATSERELLSGLGGREESPEVHAALFTGGRRLLLATNTGSAPRQLALRIPGGHVRSLLGGEEWDVPDGLLTRDLAPFEVLALEVE